jgi:hypothetical protein
MTRTITPSWDPTGTVSLRIDQRRGELTVLDEGKEAMGFRLRRDRPERLGWWRLEGGRARVRATVGEVLCHCLREWEVEQEVLAMTRAAVSAAQAEGEDWREAARRLRSQCSEARRGRRLSTLPFQKLWSHLAGQHRPAEVRLSVALAAERAGYRMPDGRADTVRLMRRLGLSEVIDGPRGERVRNRFVNYETGLVLCRALDRDPVELGL